MKNSLVRNGLVLCIIILFIGANFIPSTIGITEKKIVFKDIKSRIYIQDLIDNASAGDTIYIPSGTFYENIIINKSISLIGEDKNTTIIDGGGVVGLNGLAYDPITDKLFGASGASFYEIDMNFGSQTYIGDFNTGGLMIAISFDNMGNCYGVDIGTDSLYSIDTVTGEASLIGLLGINLKYAQDCAYDRDNEIFYLSTFNVDSDDRDVVDDRAPEKKRSWGGELYICDTETAKLTLVGPFDNGAEVTALAIPYEQETKLERRFSLNRLTNYVNIPRSRYEPFYGYCAYDPDGQIDDHTVYFNSDSPEELKTIAYTQSDYFITGGTWANGTWYGVEYGTGNIYTIDPDNGDMDEIGYGGDVVSVSVDWVNISGFTIKNSSWGSSGIEISSNFNTITGNIISDNSDGISMEDCKYNTIMSNDIYNNENNGVYIKNSSNNTIANNFISKNWMGIVLADNSNNNTITSNYIRSNGDGWDSSGIWIRSSNNNSITDNTISYNWIGATFLNSCKNTISNNTIDSNYYFSVRIDDSNSNIITKNSFIKDGLFIKNSYHNNVENNTVNDKLLLYIEDKSDIVIDYDVGQVIVVNCNNMTVENLDISLTDVAIQLIGTNYSKIRNNDCKNNNNGIFLTYSSNSNEISNNIILDNQYKGIYLEGNNNIINGNDISDNFRSCLEFGGHNNIITNNTLLDNGYYGILHYSGHYTIVKGNNISNNGYDGMALSDLNNTIKGNTISNNGGNGIRLWGHKSIVTGNTVSNNGGDGILNQGDDNTIKGNTISNNEIGINLLYCFNNTIQKNNFFNNSNDSFFTYFLPFKLFLNRNRWIHNYWDRPRLLPKLIFGKMRIFYKEITWFNIDWRPALKPHKIPRIVI